MWISRDNLGVCVWTNEPVFDEEGQVFDDPQNGNFHEMDDSVIEMFGFNLLMNKHVRVKLEVVN